AGGARFPAAGYGAAFAWLVGGTLVVGALFGPLARGLRPFDGRFPSLRLARARLGDATSRHRLAAAGLYVAVAMAAAMSVLVGSFARTMEEWIEVRFQADVFLSSRAVSSMGQEFLLEPAVIEAIAARPEVAEVDPFRVLPIDLEGKRTYLGASRHDLLAGRQKVLWLDAPATELAEATPATPVAYVNEAFVARFGWGQGAMVEVPTPSGRETVRITGVFADYGNEQGLLWIDWPVFGAWFDSDAATNLSLFLTPGTDALVAAEALEASFPGLAARDNRTLRELVRRTFRQTFAITEALKVIGIAVAVGGLALALSNLLRESRRELRTLRTLGCTRREIARATAFESLGIACVGLGGGLLASIALGALLVFVINKQSFGWTLRWALPWHEFALLALGTAVMAMTVGYFVGRRQGRLLE
ncbi:MAG: ABC transporter permease, partial [Verrucomicrobiota bacterium]